MQTLFDVLRVIPIWVYTTIIVFLIHWLLWLTAPMYRKELLKSSRAQLIGLVVLSALPVVNVIVLLFNILVHVRWEIMGVWLAKPAFRDKDDQQGS